MSYIGATPVIGNFQKCDAITTSATATFNLLVGGAAVSPATANNCIVSLNGVVQAPTTAFTIVGSTIVFASALTTSDVIDFIVILGNTLDVGVPSDDTITAAKLNDTAISGLTALGAEPADTDEFLISDAGVLKRMDYSYIKGGGNLLQLKAATKTDVWNQAASASTFYDIPDMTVDITPTLSTSKILVLVTLSIGGSAGSFAGWKIVRDSTSIAISDDSGLSNRMAASFGYGLSGIGGGYKASTNMTWLDNPATTSAVTYKVQAVGEASYSIFVNRTVDVNDNVYASYDASSITVMEIAVGVL